MTTSTRSHTEEFVEAADCRVQLRKGGQGEPLLVLHSELWAPGWIDAYQQLAKDFTVIVPSLPGFGQSSRPEWILTPRDMAAWITWCIADTKLPTPLNVVGFSLGGWLAAEIATVNRQLIKKMVLVAPTGIKPTEGEIWDYFINSRKEAFVQGFENKDAPEFQQYYGKDWTPEEAEQVEINREMACRLTWKPYMHSITLPWLAQGITTPTLIVHGRQDRIVPLNASERWRQTVKGSQLKVLDKCGHMPEMEHTTEFVKTVRDFLKAR